MIKCKKCLILKESDKFYNFKDKNRNICILCYKEYRKISDFKPESRYKKYIRDAGRRGIEFLLSREEFFSFDNKPCRYCGENVTPISLDRLVNSKGYVIDNVDACCYSCNLFKYVFKEADFLSHVEKIFNYQLGKKDV
jgi:hypothetical protein